MTKDSSSPADPLLAQEIRIPWDSEGSRHPTPIFFPPRRETCQNRSDFGASFLGSFGLCTPTAGISLQDLSWRACSTPLSRIPCLFVPLQEAPGPAPVGKYCKDAPHSGSAGSPGGNTKLVANDHELDPSGKLIFLSMGRATLST